MICCPGAPVVAAATIPGSFEDHRCDIDRQVARARVAIPVTWTWPSGIVAKFDVLWSEDLTDWSVLGTEEDTIEEGPTETVTDSLEDILDYPDAFYRVWGSPEAFGIHFTIDRL